MSGCRFYSFRLIAAVALIASSPPTPAAQTGAQRPNAALSGVVVDAVTGRPVAGAVVSLGRLDVRTQTLPRMVTDRQGRFVFLDLPASDSYYLGARRFGYAYTRYGWTKPDGSLATRDIARISLAEGQWLNTIRIPLWQLGSIEGRVIDERGESVVGTAVRAFTTARISGQEQLVAGPIATTDDRGVYRLSNLDPGRYVVAVLSVQHTVLATTPDGTQFRAVGELATGGIGGGSGAGVHSPTVDVGDRHRLALTNFATPPPPDVGSPRSYPALYYPGARTVADARPIEIDYGDSRAGIDFQLHPEPAVRVSGRLDSPLGEPPQFLLRMVPAGSERLGFGAEAATTVAEPDGRFTFLNVPSGSYTILAQASVMDFTTGSASIRFDDAPGFPQGGITVGSMTGAPGLGYLTRSGRAAPVWGRTPITVGRQDIDDLVIQLRPTVAIRGRIRLAEGAAPPEPGHLLMKAQPADGDPSMGYPSGYTKQDDPTLSFTISDLMAGRYLVSNFNGLGVVSAVWNGRDLAETGFDASLGRDFDDVIVTLTDRTPVLSGTVHGSPGPTAAVILFPVERERWANYGWQPTRLRTARSGPGGAYRIERLAKGDYFVIAVDIAHIEAWSDPAFLAAAVPQATRLSLDWGDEKTLDLTYREVSVR